MVKSSFICFQAVPLSWEKKGHIRAAVKRKKKKNPLKWYSYILLALFYINGFITKRNYDVNLQHFRPNQAEPNTRQLHYLYSSKGSSSCPLFPPSVFFFLQGEILYQCFISPLGGLKGQTHWLLIIILGFLSFLDQWHNLQSMIGILSLTSVLEKNQVMAYISALIKKAIFQILLLKVLLKDHCVTNA